MQKLNRFAYNIFVGRVQSRIKRRTLYFNFFGEGYFNSSIFTLKPNEKIPLKMDVGHFNIDFCNMHTVQVSYNLYGYEQKGRMIRLGSTEHINRLE